MDLEHIDIVVVGAVVKTYLEVHPDASIAILESSSSLGGTWASDRLYPELRTNSLLGAYENPDFPMTPGVFDVKPGGHVPGPVLHEYLVQFAEKFGVLDKIQFETKVEEIEQDADDRWIISVTRLEKGEQKSKKIVADKLILATGLTGNPNMPEIPGASSFDGPIYHSKEFLQNKGLLTTAKSVVVYGASKSGWDAVYAYACAGVRVEWVMRESGRGPGWMSPMWVMGGKRLEYLAFTRYLTWFNPMIWGANDGYGFWKRILHGNFVGRWIVNKFWHLLEMEILDLNQFDSHCEKGKLKPWSGAPWSGTNLGIHNYPTDFYDNVRDGTVRVYHGDIASLSSHTVHLSTGETLKGDALHCSTGWKHMSSIKFSPPSLVIELGLPNDHGPSSNEFTSDIDAEIMSRFPFLKNQPNVTPKRDPGKILIQDKEMPYRLYRYMIPPARANTRNFAVAGAILTFQHPTAAQIQALWILAYLDGTLPLERSMEELKYETEKFARFGRWRSPGGYGGKCGDLAFETIPYFDDLLGDLGLKFKRKDDWLKEMTEPYLPGDYEGIVREWVEMRKEEERTKGPGSMSANNFWRMTKGKVMEGVFGISSHHPPTINKPKGLSSAQVLRDLQKHFNPSTLFAPWISVEKANRDREKHNQRKRRREKNIQVKIGHGGTLDPLATGVLIAGIGKGTKALQDFLLCTKQYETVVLFGASTDTYDRVGKVLRTAPYEHVTREVVEAALGQYRGKFMQLPPLFSALKMNGKPLYEYAREGKPIPREIERRPVEVLELELVEWMEPGTHTHKAPSETGSSVEINFANKIWSQEKVLPGGSSPAKEVKKEDAEVTGEPTETEGLETRKRKLSPEQDELVHERPVSKHQKSASEDTAIMSGGLAAPTSPAASPSSTSPHEEGATKPAPPGPPAARIRMKVTSGFYVRSLAHDLGAAVGSAALMAELERSRQGEFTLGANVLEYSDLDKGEEVWGPKVEAMLDAWNEKRGDGETSVLKGEETEGTTVKDEVVPETSAPKKEEADTTTVKDEAVSEPTKAMA
ncbi:FAD-dependent monooxygenase [Lachnellula occidentalis]|uniref:tRNA pseudouridine(55) synthase n=1 Tax=Lachnellula occidentalis TaxID=215460 RepID=A0A8H8RGZ4_9HELO|nr:FAD-dependent monooxygenase [Lachnellula occidentalis]